MRWFIVLLLLANLGLFFWLQHDALPDASVVALPPPDVGRLQLLHDNPVPPGAISPRAASPEVQPSAVANGQAIAMGPSPSEPAVAVASAPESPIPDTALQRQMTSLRTTEETIGGDVLEETAVDRSAERANLTSEPAESVAAEDSGRSDRVDTTSAVGSVVDAGPVSPDRGSSDEPMNTATLVSVPPDAGKIPPADEPETEPSCALVGPMTSEAADALIGQLPAFIDLLSDMTVEVRDVDAYFVMIPPLPSRAAGLAVLKRLEAEGITDTWLFPRGVYRNAISLGLFSRRAGAERHLRRVNQRGFEAELIEKGRREERRQLLVKNVDGGDVALSLPLPEGVVAEKRPCP